MNRTFSFLIITTHDLPEAYYLASFLLGRGQRVGLLNIEGRTLSQQLSVAARIRRNRGIWYLSDLALGKALRRYYQAPDVVPFPDIREETMAHLRRRCRYQAAADLHGQQALDFARSVGPDYLLIAGAPVLKQPMLELARFGALNRHLGLAPHYRGSDCPLWALFSNELDRIGFTIHFVTEKVDGGDIVLQRTVPPTRAMDFSQYLAYLQLKASEAYVQVLKQVLAGQPLSRQPQQPGGKHFPPAGLRVIRGAHERYQAFLRGGVR